MSLKQLPEKMPDENTAKLRELADWLIKQGDKTRVGDWVVDADFMCVADDSNVAYRGDIGGLVATEYLKAATAAELHASDYTQRDVSAIWINTFGTRGEFYESFVNVDEVLEDYSALSDKITVADYGETLRRYLDRGVRGEVSWAWYLDRLDSIIV